MARARETAPGERRRRVYIKVGVGNDRRAAEEKWPFMAHTTTRINSL